MSRTVWIKLNKPGVGELLKSKDMQNVTKELAENIKNRAGGDAGYSVTTEVGKTRCNASIAITDVKLLGREKKNNTLIKSLRG